MGLTTPSISMQLNNDKNALSKFRRDRRREDQLAFDEMWVNVYNHLLYLNQSNHLLPIEMYLLVMLLEKHKEVNRLVEELQK